MDGLTALIAGPAVSTVVAPIVSTALGQSISSMQSDNGARNSPQELIENT